MTTFNFSFFFLLVQSTHWTALFFAAKDGNMEVTRLLIQGGANVWLKDKVLVHSIPNISCIFRHKVHFHLKQR